jgi:hypothetical protein
MKCARRAAALVGNAELLTDGKVGATSVNSLVEGLELGGVDLVGGSDGLALITSNDGHLFLAGTSTRLNTSASTTSNAKFLTDSEVVAGSVDDGVKREEGSGADTVLGGNSVAKVTGDDGDLLGAVVTSAIVVVAAVVASSSTSSASLDLEVDTVIERTVLSDGDENGLMVGCRVDRAQAVGTSGETLVDGSRELTLAVSGQVQSLEECKDIRVQSVLALEIVNLFDGNVRMTDDDALIVDLLRSGVIVGSGVDEIAALNVFDFHRDCERLVLVEIRGKVFGKDEFGRGHLVDSDDTTHWSLVAGSTFFLNTVGQGNLLGQAKVDEVVGRGQGTDLSSGNIGTSLTVVLESLHDIVGVERQRSLSITLSTGQSRGGEGRGGEQSSEDGSGCDHCVFDFS